MRDLPFLLRLHAFPPLARFSRTPRKPYLPLEVRYLIRPSEEVFLYLSNNSDNKTWGDDLSLIGTRACLQTSYRSQISEAARHTKAAKTSASLS